MRALIVVKAADKLVSLTKKTRVLDIGSAEGLTLLEIRSLLPGGDYTGLEYYDDFAKYTPNLPSDTRIIYGDAMNLPESVRNNQYDIVSALAALEHIPEPLKALKEAAGVLRPGGIFVATSPVPLWDKISVSLSLLKTNSHITEITRDRISELIRESGMELISYEKFMWAPIALLPYMNIHVSPYFADNVDGIVRKFFIFNWLFINQAIVARKPL